MDTVRIWMNKNEFWITSPLAPPLPHGPGGRGHADPFEDPLPLGVVNFKPAIGRNPLPVGGLDRRKVRTDDLGFGEHLGHLDGPYARARADI